MSALAGVSINIIFTILLDLKTFIENTYNGSFSLKDAKSKQRSMANMLVKLDYCNSKKKDKFKAQSEVTLFNAEELYKGRK